MQYTDEDIDAAVAAGAIGADAAASFRALVERRRATPAPDEEAFRLLTGFNDVFVAIALVLSLSALAWLAGQIAAMAAGVAVAAASWALAEFFTRRRRMALPSILLLFGFVGGVGFAVVALIVGAQPERGPLPAAVALALAGAIAAFAHWRPFKVPVTVAAGVLTVGGAAVAVVGRLFENAQATLAAVLVAGLLAFALALAWDISDRLRRTRRADVAFWLHMLAAPALVHSLFALLGVSPELERSAPDPHLLAHAALAVAIYAALAVVALTIDRRALTVSGLLYLIFAMNAALRATGALTLSFALSALIVGAALLLLSAFWSSARRRALRLAPPGLRERLPPSV